MGRVACCHPELPITILVPRRIFIHQDLNSNSSSSSR